MTFSDAPACALHAELRRATRQAHRDLDRHPVLLPLTGSATLPEYQRALGAMYAITAPVESRVGAYLDARRPRLDYQVRRRMPNLMRDLEFYGLTPPGPAWSGAPLLLIKRVAAIADARITVLGDNPSASQDSRHFGPIDMRSVIGVARAGGRR